MNATRFQEISALADTIRASLELRVPVDVQEAVARLGGTVLERKVGPNQPEAAVYKEGERFKIALEHSVLPARKRFSIAHELGHLFLHMGYLTDPDSWKATNEYQDSVYHRFGYGTEEAEANLFAAAFLMPENEFRVAVQMTNGSKDQVKDLAAHFRTSASAVLRRGQELGLFRLKIGWKAKT